MPDGGVITVAARNVEPSSGAARGFVEIIVADDGKGMPEEVLSQAFNPYFSTKTANSGTRCHQLSRIPSTRRPLR
jgi:signal transduction histidine kinase